MPSREKLDKEIVAAWIEDEGTCPICGTDVYSEGYDFGPGEAIIEFICHSCGLSIGATYKVVDVDLSNCDYVAYQKRRSVKSRS